MMLTVLMQRRNPAKNNSGVKVHRQGLKVTNKREYKNDDEMKLVTEKR